MAAEDPDTVDFSDKKLDKIPEEVLVKCDSIRILNLSGNCAIRLDHSLKFFGNVTKLVLNRCALSRIPDEMSELTKLEHLSLTGNDFSVGLNPALWRLRGLKTLELGSCKLASLPDSIGNLEQLEHLTLTDNDFSVGLNPRLGRLRRLKTLELGLCKLESLPDSIRDLQQLEKLVLSSHVIDIRQTLRNDSYTVLGRTFYRNEYCIISQDDWCKIDYLKLKKNDFSRGLNPALGRLGLLKVLNLEGCNLTSLPDTIGDMEQLEHLTLTNNNFSAGLDPVLLRLRGLKTLELGSCKLACLPNSIGNLEQLEHLTLTGNDFSVGLNPAIGRLRQLKTLKLGSCQLESLPDSIGNLQQLEKLVLFSPVNEIITISACLGTKMICTTERKNDFSRGLNPSLGRLSLLKVLNLEACKLTSLPDTIGDMEQLEHLILTNNDFSVGLTLALGRLRHLKTLELGSCKLASLPDSIGNMEQLEHLTLTDNDFSIGLNPAIGRLCRLKSLELGSCKLASIPDSIADLHQLEHLTLIGNDFSVGLNPAVMRLHRLKTLELCYCELASLPDSFGDLLQLERLMLRGNSFSVGLTPALGRLRHLKRLEVDRCKLARFPDAIRDLQQVEHLVLSNNDFSRGLDPALGRLGLLKVLKLNGCNLTSLPDTIGDLQQLEHLMLSNNDFSAGLNPALGKLGQLKTLELVMCNLASLPASIRDLQQLKYLTLSNNCFSVELNPEVGRLCRLKVLILTSCKLARLPDSIGDLQQLKHLYLADNNFSVELNPAVGRLRRLKILKLSSCKLARLPDSIGDLQQLGYLFLSDNKLEEYPQCTLRLKKLRYLDISNSVIHAMLRGKSKVSRENEADGNRVKSLPVELAFTNIVNLELRGNPITEPPREIWSRGIASIKSFMRAVIPGGELMYADTLNLIGDTGAGKSSVCQSMIANSPKVTAAADRTHVLQQRRLNMQQQSVIINDFGGHEIYHSVMPIFLPTNGLLVLVYNMMDEDQEQKVNKWMLTALAKSKQTRMIIVGTHADQVATREKRLDLERRMESFSKEILQNALDEVDFHIHFLLRTDDKTGYYQNKLISLRTLYENLTNADVPVVTLSCCKTDDGLNQLLDVVAKSLRPPMNLPVRWCRVINDMLNLKADSLYITFEDVERICEAHFTADDDSEALSTILSFLAKTSQIIWLESHPLLQGYIFHSPQRIIDACKMIIHHDNVTPKSLSHYVAQLNDYNMGILQESLLQKLLSAPIDSVHDGNGQSASQGRQTNREEVVVGFLQHFNLISYVRKLGTGKEFIVPCKLTMIEPEEKLQTLQQIGSACPNRVTVRLSFIGSIIPLSLFETSLSSMLTVAGELSQHVVWPNVWKDGAIICYNGVNVITRRVDGVIVFTAFSKPTDPSPWTVLHPILKHLNDYILTSWHGAPPTCSIVCPLCVRREQYIVQAAEIEIDLEALVSEDGRSCERLTCKNCMQPAPRSLCFPIKKSGVYFTDELELRQFFSDAGVFVADKQEILKFFQDAGSEGMAVLNEHDAPPRQSRSLACHVLENLRRCSSHIVSRLTRDEARTIARILWEKGWLISAEKERLFLDGITDTDAAVFLVDVVLKKSSNDIVQAFLAVLEDVLKRNDLVTAILR